MALVGAQRASELTGISRSTIQRHMKSGKVSCVIDDKGHKSIDVAELERVYGIKQQKESEPVKTVASDDMEAERLRLRVEMLELRLEISQNQIDDLKSQRDQWQRQASQVLITSQHSQKEAQEYKTLLKARQKKEAAARKAAQEKREIAKKLSSMKAENQNTNSGVFKGIWQKVRAVSNG